LAELTIRAKPPLRGNKVQAARALGIALSTLYEKLKRYGV
jgi:transcriptional regulator of acetoin/glycerol metabolism